MASETPAPAVFESIALIVSDLEAATQFYRETLGMQLTAEFPGDYASLQLPSGPVLGLHVPHNGTRTAWRRRASRSHSGWRTSTPGMLG